MPITPRHLLNRTVYLDKAYIADLFEVLTGESPSTVITMNEGKKAGAAVPFFSGEISAQESRSFSVSTLQMLSRALPDLEQEPRLDPNAFTSGMTSQFGWLEGELTVMKAKASVAERATGELKTLASDSFFQLRLRPGASFALITTPEYFLHGFNTFLRMQETVLKEMSIPVRAYVRTLAAQSYYQGEWVAVPLVVLERESDG